MRNQGEKFPRSHKTGNSVAIILPHGFYFVKKSRSDKCNRPYYLVKASLKSLLNRVVIAIRLRMTAIYDCL